MPKIASPEVLQKRMELSERLLNALTDRHQIETDIDPDRQVTQTDYPAIIGTLMSIITTQIKLPQLEQIVLFQETE